jgi:hypothetical protein
LEAGRNSIDGKLFSAFNYTSRITAHNRACWHISGHNRSRGHDCAFPDPNAAENDGTYPNPYVVFHNDFPFCAEGLLLHPDSRRRSVVIRVKATVGSNHRMRSNTNGRQNRNYRGALSNRGKSTDFDTTVLGCTEMSAGTYTGAFS